MKKWITPSLLLAAWSCLQAEQPVLERIVLFGNTRMREGTVIRQIGIRPLKAFDDSLLNKEKFWLIRLGFLRRVDFLTKPGSTPDQRILMVVMREKSRFSVSPSLHSDHLFGWTGGFDVEYRNLRGTRERMDFSILAGKYKKMHLAWQIPDLLPAWQLFFSTEIGRRDFPYLFPDFKPSFSFREDRLCLTLGKRFGRRLSAGTGLGWESVQSGTGRPDHRAAAGRKTESCPPSVNGIRGTGPDIRRAGFISGPNGRSMISPIRSACRR